MTKERQLEQIERLMNDLSHRVDGGFLSVVDDIRKEMRKCRSESLLQFNVDLAVEILRKAVGTAQNDLVAIEQFYAALKRIAAGEELRGDPWSRPADG